MTAALYAKFSSDRTSPHLMIISIPEDAYAPAARSPISVLKGMSRARASGRVHCS